MVGHMLRAPRLKMPRKPFQRCRAQAPQRIIQTIAFKDRQQRQRFIVGLGLAQVLEQLSPAFTARIMRADFV
jgi:hypothetical protein